MQNRNVGPCGHVVMWALCACVVGALWWSQPTAVSAYKYLRTESNGRVYHWKRNKFPVQMILDNRTARNLTIGAIEQVVNLSMGTWNAVPCSISELKLKSVAAGNNVPAYDGIHVIKFLNSGTEWKWSAQQVALTIQSVNLQTGEILDADLVLNDWKFNWGVDGSQGKFDVQATITHEMGHVLGLGHSLDQGASMYASANTGETSKRNLNKDDRDGLCALYPDQPCEEGKLIGSDLVCYNGRQTPICPRYHELCKDCSQNSHADCGGENDYCLNLSEKMVCGWDCSNNKPCPGGYTCVPVQQQQNGQPVTVGQNCVPDSRNCANAAKPPCCRDNNDCLPGFSCSGGNCLQAQTCAKEGQACAGQSSCCTDLLCVNANNTGGTCRTKCDPLKPRCNGTFRCAVADGNAFKEGACVPPRNGGKENAACDNNNPCEYELGCDPKDSRCRFFCRVNDAGNCPAGSRCVAVSQGSDVGLCYKETAARDCTSSADCATGQACVNKKCGPCVNDNDCINRPVHQCVQSKCLQTCTVSAECPTQHRCDKGLCQPGTFCTADKDCGNGEICNQSICMPAGTGGCKSDQDCAAGQRCGTDGLCQASDACNNKCNYQTESCTAGKCVPRTCSSSAECGQGLVCRSSRCEPEITNCGGQGACPTGQLCDNNRCVGDLGYACLGDENCAAGLTCAQGGSVRLCAKVCDPAQSKACPDGYFCTRLAGIGAGCWPATRSECKTNGNCTPKGEGCSCSATGPQPMLELLVLACLLLLVSARRRFV